MVVVTVVSMTDIIMAVLHERLWRSTFLLLRRYLYHIHWLVGWLVLVFLCQELTARDHWCHHVGERRGGGAGRSRLVLRLGAAPVAAVGAGNPAGYA